MTEMIKTMARRIIVILVLAVGTVLCASAQNSIDGMIDRFSAAGRCKFTSAVERDPVTRKVRKVVNVLELHDAGINKFVSAFRRESSAGDFTERYDNTGCTMMLTTQNARQSRIYMLKCDGPYNPGSRNTSYSRAKVTLIVKYK